MEDRVRETEELKMAHRLLAQAMGLVVVLFTESEEMTRGVQTSFLDI